MRSYEVKLPRGYTVDVFNLPEDFDDQIGRVFSEYTSGTSKDYTYHDILLFLDICCENAHHEQDADEEVHDLVSDYINYNWEECGQLDNSDDVYSAEFMEACYKEGARNHSLYDDYDQERHTSDAIMMMLYRIMKVLANYEAA